MRSDVSSLITLTDALNNSIQIISASNSRPLNEKIEMSLARRHRATYSAHSHSANFHFGFG